MAFVKEQFSVSERRACKLLGVDRSTYRYEPRPDRNAQLRGEMIALARQKTRYGYRRLHAILTRRGYAISVMRLYRLHSEEGLAVRQPNGSYCAGQPSIRLCVWHNQEWALDFVADTIGTGRGIRVSPSWTRSRGSVWRSKSIAA
jgi:putative transposase